jgi:hypothetical protein
MMPDDTLMLIEKPHMRVKLRPRKLEVDLTEGVRKEIENLVESREALRETLGFMFQTLIPLDVPLKDIQSTGLDEKGRVKIVIPHRRDLHIPLPSPESEAFLAKLDEALSVERARVTGEEREHRREFEARQPGRKHFDEDSLKSSDIE